MVDQNSQFYAILTNVGAAKQANADALGLAWKITQMAIGDANGTDPTPSATQTSLINEWRRAPLNQLKVDDNDPSIIVAEQVIPADIGGKWIREISLIDEDGDTVAVANCAPTYKPLLSQGSGRTQVVRMSLVVSSAANVQLKIDPSVVLATREWVTEELARQDFKHSVLVATTAGINLTGLQTVDGVALTAGARVLVKNQTTAKENGIYTVVSGGPWTRAVDANSNAKVAPGLLVLVEKGTVNSDSAWQLVTDAPISLDVTALTFEMAFGRSGVTAGTYRSVQVDKYGRVVAATNPTTVAGYGLTDVYTKAETYSRTEITQAIVGAVATAVSGLVDAAPGALDTLKELASAIGNDPNFATTMVNELAKKAPLASPKFTGSPETPTPAVGSTGLQVANMSALATAVATAARQFKSAIIGVNTNLTLTAAQMGNAVQFNTGPVTLTLPALADVGNGASVMLRNPSSSATQTITVASSGSIVDAGSTVTSTTIKPFEWMELASSGSAWFIVGRGKLKEVAELDSPKFTGVPEAPTAPVGTNTAQVATMAAVLAALQAFGLGTTIGVMVTDFDAVEQTSLFRVEGGALHSPFPGASMVALHIQYNQTGCFQLAAGCSSNIGNARLFWRTKAGGAWADWQAVSRLDSPNLSGIPTAPTAGVGTNTAQIATMAALLQGINAFKRNYSGNVVGVGANLALTGSQTGYAFNATAPVTITLPPAAEAGSGGTYVIRNVSSGNVTLSYPSAGSIYEKNAGANSAIISPGEWVEIQASTSSYFINKRGPLNDVGKLIADALAAVGLGTDQAPICADVDAQSTSGFFFVSTSSSLNMPYANNGFLLQFPWNGTSAALQFYVAASVDKLMYRAKSSGTWRPWKDLPSLDGVITAINNVSRSFRAQPIIGIAANMSLNTTTHLGAVFQFNANALTVTLPSSVTVADGSVVTLRNPRAATQTLAVAAGSVVEEGVTGDKLILEAYEWVEMASSGASWFVTARGKVKESATVEQLNAAVVSAAPPGMVAHFARSTPPSGWLKRNGAAVSRTTYAALFAEIGTQFGAGDGSTTFNLPDDRELIDRAWTDGLNAADAGRALFSPQAGQLESHEHAARTGYGGGHSHTTNFVRERIAAEMVATGGNAVFGDQQSDGTQTLTSSSVPNHMHTVTVDPTGGNETRMANRAYLACIKY
ncbi:phage tail protein [Pseudomonas sp. NPDC089758]|uniref:phage tail-collar fiber domain-containing protein n=1 Tax=Pseudomonas sp. NPDC089758 TaxID=3364473 RepID=UPI0038068046